MNDGPTEAQHDHVECGATKDPAVRWGFIPAAILIGYGLYCAHDAFLTDKFPYAKPSESFNKFAYWAFNHFGAFVFTLLGIYALVWGILFLRRRLIADEGGIGYAGKSKVPWEKVERLDTAKLEKKGILCLHHEGGKKLKLDSWKLRNFKELVTIIEKHVGAKGERPAGGEG
ncbi:MAG: hypothetical protein ACYTF6_01865 [Planctomycetota bacterium]|jgi:hypothetical protein